jgi:extracellular elastinolytic metalloproteinase
VIICNNVPDPSITMAPGTDGDQVTIPTLMIDQDLCVEFKAFPGLVVGLSSSGVIGVPNPGPTGRSSDLDNGVIVHEYGHGISIRLTGGAGSSCLSGFEQAGEGWSDWFALAMTTTSANNADEPRGIGTYAAGQQPTGGGIRTHPYTRNMNVNPHTYADINSESVPHGVGSVFCATIWDMYWNLVDVYGFDDNLYTGTGGNNIAIQLVTDGLKLQPCSPSFLDSRDAILAADMANYDGANQCLIWETFARRGIGFSAEPGGVEAFDLPFDCREEFKVQKTGIAEAQSGDTITYELEIANGRLENLTEDGLVFDQLPNGVTFLEGSSDCNITELDGELTINAGQLNSEETIFCSYQVVLDPDLGTEIVFEDDLESGAQNWEVESTIGDLAWNITSSNTNSGASAFFVPNPETQSEQFLTFGEPRF